MKARKVLIFSVMFTAVVAGNAMLNHAAESNLDAPVIISGTTSGGKPVDPMTFLDKIKLVLNA